MKSVASLKARSSYVKPYLTEANVQARLKFAMSHLEPMALRSVKSNSFITKVMFLVDVARPQYDYSKCQMFDGKIGVWPFVSVSSAARTSKNRPKGTMLTAPIAVNGDVYFETVLKKVVPAIQEKIPLRTKRQGVFVQQDNVSPHRTVTTSALEARGVAEASRL
ncbi:hypothetical protein H310_09450 [Aphanomyces invadans]|uniref:Transposase Tc1-like domain-containing protein n=1 Tax=Aphanomyces invadans TaxID=157072 RepID=A0A024TV83_9STRA|nr:hypothetical protein H310_09450 [Aphanomyces invadans]ETV97536.1 hypothetical protein H310_09450 [Aphanomyces invadans]|eukprot:XP_008873745.1 hypothetical protein H310_09450 [Aphanomyces invadans]